MVFNNGEYVRNILYPWIYFEYRVVCRYLYTCAFIHARIHTHWERNVKKLSHAIFRSGTCRTGQEGEHQAWVTTAVLRQNYFWKPQFFLLQIFNWLDEAHSCYWGCWGGEKFSPTLPELFWLVWSLNWHKAYSEKKIYICTYRELIDVEPKKWPKR